MRIAGVRGEPPPATLKVTANLDAGWRNAMTLALTGAQVAEKARFAADAVWAGIPGGRGGLRRDGRGALGRPHRRRHGLPAPGRARRRRAGGRPGLLGRGRRDQPVELPRHLLHLGALGGPGRGPLLADHGQCRRGLARASSATGPRSPPRPRPRSAGAPMRRRPVRRRAAAAPAGAGRGGDLVRVPLWVLVGARSGDKGGDANVGVWADEDDVAAWLQRDFTADVFTALLPEVEPFAVSRYPLPNLRAVNFVVHGILGWGVASNLRLDTQAKGLGELLRSRLVDVPAGAAWRAARPRRDSPRPDGRPGGRRPGIWQDDAVESIVRLVALDRGHRHRRLHDVERVHVARRAPCDVLAGHAHAGPRPRRRGPPDRPASSRTSRRATASCRSWGPPPWSSCS